ncbi:hypothetical protein ZIOFF_073316 [Zingiber officinale]|uniref:Nucleoside-diphosphate kinase n=1 Tax=Zingiber officinale TaxID=94328 RepID=A0A8J5ETP9_ZINOF|nr:hypothetical protein ZIOFF_073316 [Zingiber officinale]
MKVVPSVIILLDNVSKQAIETKSGLKLVGVERSFAEKHYADLSAKPFFGSLVEYIISGPVVAMEDVKLMAELGLDSYRFSISWSRLLPNGRGFSNPKGLQFYTNFIDELVKYG